LDFFGYGVDFGDESGFGLGFWFLLFLCAPFFFLFFSCFLICGCALFCRFGVWLGRESGKASVFAALFFFRGFCSSGFLHDFEFPRFEGPVAEGSAGGDFGIAVHVSVALCLKAAEVGTGGLQGVEKEPGFLGVDPVLQELAHDLADGGPDGGGVLEDG